MAKEVNIARAEDTTLAELPAASLCAVRIFEKLRIDYRCAGQRTLREAC